MFIAIRLVVFGRWKTINRFNHIQNEARLHWQTSLFFLLFFSFVFVLLPPVNTIAFCIHSIKKSIRQYWIFDEHNYSSSATYWLAYLLSYHSRVCERVAPKNSWKTKTGAEQQQNTITIFVQSENDKLPYIPPICIND